MWSLCRFTKRFAWKLQLKDLPRNFLRILKPGGFMPPPAAFSKSVGRREFLLVKGQLFMWEVKWRRNGSQIFSSMQEIWESDSSEKDPSIKSQVIPQKSTEKEKKQQSLLRIFTNLNFQLIGSNCQLTRFGRVGTDLNLFSLLLQRLHRSICRGVEFCAVTVKILVETNRKSATKKRIHSPHVKRKESGFLALPAHFQTDLLFHLT